MSLELGLELGRTLTSGVMSWWAFQMLYHSAKRLLRSRGRVRVRVRVRGLGVKTRQDKTKIRKTRHV